VPGADGEDHGPVEASSKYEIFISYHQFMGVTVSVAGVIPPECGLRTKLNP
jgi:hypothetical protein